MVFPIFSLLSLISSPQILSYACSTYSNTTHLCRCLSPFSIWRSSSRESARTIWEEGSPRLT